MTTVITIVSYDGTEITIVIYDHKTFKIQVTLG
jgi:hypothetical protein